MAQQEVDSSPDLDFAAKLWQSANKLRGQVDATKYELFLGKFARTKGKLGGDFYTPCCGCN